MKVIWGRGVAVNMPACQAGDRGFKSRRSREVGDTPSSVSFCLASCAGSWSSIHPFAISTTRCSSTASLPKRLRARSARRPMSTASSESRRTTALRAAFAPLDARIHYSVKANGSLAILRHALGAGGRGLRLRERRRNRPLPASRRSREDIVFAGVGKTRDEIAFAVSQAASAGSMSRICAELLHQRSPRTHRASTR